MNYQSILKFVYAFGIPAAIAVYLIYFLVAVVNAHLQNIDANLKSHQVDSAYVLKNDIETRAQFYILSQMLQKVCVNTATSQAARNNCFGIQPPVQ